MNDYKEVDETLAYQQNYCRKNGKIMMQLKRAGNKKANVLSAIKLATK